MPGSPENRVATIGLATDPLCNRHHMGETHPERPERLQTLLDLVASDDVTEFGLVPLDIRQATHEEIVAVHANKHIDSVRATQGGWHRFDADTVACPDSYDAALRAAGCALEATDAVLTRKVDSSFALVRPPGHHAEPDRVMGFCLFNNVALAARHARAAHGIGRIAIIDFDVHHGNGTQAAFYDDPETLFISTHQFPCYPGTGETRELGSTDAAGSTLNFPLRAGHGDTEYAAIYGAVITRVLEQFGPELILVSAGFDLMDADPLAGMRVSDRGIHAIASALVESAKRLCEGRIVFLLEGGYDLDALRAGVLACFDAMANSRAETPLVTLDESVLGDTRHHLRTYREFYKL